MTENKHGHIHLKLPYVPTMIGKLKACEEACFIIPKGEIQYFFLKEFTYSTLFQKDLIRLYYFSPVILSSKILLLSKEYLPLTRDQMLQSSQYMGNQGSRWLNKDSASGALMKAVGRKRIFIYDCSVAIHCWDKG